MQGLPGLTTCVRAVTIGTMVLFVVNSIWLVAGPKGHFDPGSLRVKPTPTPLVPGAGGSQNAAERLALVSVSGLASPRVRAIIARLCAAAPCSPGVVYGGEGRLTLHAGVSPERLASQQTAKIPVRIRASLWHWPMPQTCVVSHQESQLESLPERILHELLHELARPHVPGSTQDRSVATVRTSAHC